MVGSQLNMISPGHVKNSQVELRSRMLRSSEDWPEQDHICQVEWAVIISVPIVCISFLFGENMK